MLAARCSVATQRARLALRCPVFSTSSKPPGDNSAIPVAVAVPTGLVAGMLSSLCGIGGGVVIIPSLTSFTAMEPHAVAAASLFCVSVASMTGAASYLEQVGGMPHVVNAEALFKGA